MFWIENNYKITYDEFLHDLNYSCKKELNSYRGFIDLLRGVTQNKFFDNIDNFLNFLKDNSQKKNFITSTSGTTSKRKDVKVSLEVCLRQIKPDKSNKVWGLFYPPNSYAFSQVIFQALFNRQTIVNCYGLPYAKQELLLKQNEVTNITCTPSFLNMILVNFKDNLDALEAITLGGEILSDLTLTNVRKKYPNIRLINIYASTEAGSLLYSNDNIFEIPKSLSDKIDIIDSELVIHKSLVNKSSSIKFKEDYFYTGDIVKYIDNNRFKFLNRKDGFINVGGQRVNPLEVEELIKLNIPEIEDVRVYGMKNSILGKILIAEVITSKYDIKSLKQEIKKRLIKEKVPQIVRIVNKLTLTESGKKIRS